MRRILLFIIGFCGSFSFNSCKKDKTTTLPITEVHVRVLNSTSLVFYDCTVDPVGTLSDNPGVSAHNYGQINISTSSDYYTFSKAYNYAWFRLTMNNRMYYLKPFDYVGETPLANGQYTYKITYSVANDRLNLELIKD